MIQYNHQRLNNSTYTGVDSRGGQTIAFEVPQAWFLKTLQPGDFFEKKVGKARCSNDDNYNKKIGRELASSRMKSTKLICTSNIEGLDDRMTILQDPQGNLYILRSKSEGVAHFIDYE